MELRIYDTTAHPTTKDQKCTQFRLSWRWKVRSDPTQRDSKEVLWPVLFIHSIIWYNIALRPTVHHDALPTMSCPRALRCLQVIPSKIVQIQTPRTRTTRCTSSSGGPSPRLHSGQTPLALNELTVLQSGRSSNGIVSLLQTFKLFIVSGRQASQKL
jgi:hypothetical protein